MTTTSLRQFKFRKLFRKVSPLNDQVTGVGLRAIVALEVDGTINVIKNGDYDTEEGHERFF